MTLVQMSAECLFCAAAFILPKYCRYGVQHYIINQLINQTWNFILSIENKWPLMICKSQGQGQIAK